MTERWVSRFSEKIFPVTESGCWIWDSEVNKSHGYGMFLLNGKYVRAHRVSYELFKGPIPKGLHIDHLCRVKCCVNPDHLEAVTNRVNVLRGVGATAVNARKETCPYGHKYDSIKRTRCKRTKGVQVIQRVCKSCVRVANHSQYLKRKLAALAKQGGKK